MRTRNQSKRQEESSGNEDVREGACSRGKRSCTMSPHDSGTLTTISEEAVGRLLKRAKGCSLAETKKQDSYIRYCESSVMQEGVRKRNGKQTVSTKVTANTPVTESCSTEATGSSPSARKDEEGSSLCTSLGSKKDRDEVDWEDGSIPISCSTHHHPIQEVTVEFSESPSSAKRKPIRRASAEDKELAELVHKVHLLCLLSRGRLIDSACDDPLIQASLLSLLPSHLLMVGEISKLTANALLPVVNWFNNNFHVRGTNTTERSFKSGLAVALETHEGTAEEVAALSVALFRALNLTTRFVSILDVACLKPEVEMPGCLNQDANMRDSSGIFNFSTLMVSKPSQISASPAQLSPHKTSSNEDMVRGTSCGDSGRICESNVTCKTSMSKNSAILDNLNDDMLDSLAGKASNYSSEVCLEKKAGESKRKGDIEFEMQLEMALSATAAGAHDSDPGSNLKDLHISSSDSSFPTKKLKRIKHEESPFSSQGISTAVGSRKIGPPLYWAEVYCSGENLTGKWVHVDVANAIIDGEQKVEAAAAACRRSLRYVVAFAGHGAKDVTRRYCMKWYKIASQRINAHWWDAVLAPLKELESGATGGHASLPREFSMQESMEHAKKNDEESSADFSKVASRNSLEDMELETRALTEPLPTNQQAYRNHPLYAIEKWLTKYQILHPKGPVLGFCSGQTVYPRTCVQTLQSKQRWLREGLQVKSNELPAKLVKRTPKLNKVQPSESSICDEEDSEGTIALFGKWQMEPLHLPCAVNGIVPKNDRGQVDVWSEKCLPPGTVHLRLPRLVPVAKRLEINFAPAMVGFEFRNGRSIPVFEGIVVCTEFKDALLEAYAEAEERREAEEKKRNEAQAISRWYQLLSSIITRQRLNNSYKHDLSSDKSVELDQKDDKTCISNIGDGIQSESQQKHLRVSKSQTRSVVSAEDHEHVFPKESQSFDEESMIRTKRCPCGFSVQVEEL